MAAKAVLIAFHAVVGQEAQAHRRPGPWKEALDVRGQRLGVLFALVLSAVVQAGFTIR